MGPSAMSALRHSPVGDWRLGHMPSIAFAFLVVALHSGTSLADAAKEGTYLYTFTDQAKAIRRRPPGYEKLMLKEQPHDTQRRFFRGRD